MNRILIIESYSSATLDSSDTCGPDFQARQWCTRASWQAAPDKNPRWLSIIGWFLGLSQATTFMGSCNSSFTTSSSIKARADWSVHHNWIYDTCCHRSTPYDACTLVVPESQVNTEISAFVDRVGSEILESPEDFRVRLQFWCNCLCFTKIKGKLYGLQHDIGPKLPGQILVTPGLQHEQ